MQNFRSVYVEEGIDSSAKSDALAHSLNSRGILSDNQPKLASGERIIYMSSLPIIYWRLSGYNC